MTPIIHTDGKWFVIQNMPERYCSDCPVTDCECPRYHQAIKDAPKIEVSNPEMLTAIHIRKMDDGEWRIKTKGSEWHGEPVNEGDIYYWPGGCVLTGNVDGEYGAAVLTHEPEQKPTNFCSTFDPRVVAHFKELREQNSAHSFTEGSDSNLYVCPHTKQACFHSNCTYGYCGNPPAPVDNQEESQDELWETVLLVIKLCEEKGCNKVISLKGIFDLTRKK
jgi:hypothetical protein